MDNTENTKQIFDNCANQYQDKFMNIELYQDTIDTFYNNIKAKKASVLELGCGPGNITKYILSNRPDFNILGIDLAPKMITLAKKNNPTANFKVMDVREISTLNTKYDGILSGFCLPYLSKKEAIQFILDSFKLLNTNGVLYISTMEDEQSKSGFQGSSSCGKTQMYINYHEAGYLTNVLNEKGFEILSLTHQENGSTNTDLIIIAKKY